MANGMMNGMMGGMMNELSGGLVGDVMGGMVGAGLGMPRRVSGAGRLSRGARMSRSSVFLWEVVLLLSIATWNVPGLFGSIQSSLGRTRWKQGNAAQLLTAHQVVALQEVHGNKADLSVLAGRNHVHHFFGTFCELVGPYDNSRAGGVVPVVDKDLCRRVGEARVEVLEEGGMIAVCLGDRESSLLLIAVHIDPMKTPLQKRVVVDAIRACCDRHPGAWVFVFGDFNFSYRGDYCV